MEQYGSPILPHITLTQSRYIEQSQGQEIISQIRKEIVSYDKDFPLTIATTEVTHKEFPTGMDIFSSTPSSVLDSIQKVILTSLPSDLSFVYPKRSSWDQEVWWHVTLGIHIPKDTFSTMDKKYSLKNLQLSVKVNNVIALLAPSLSVKDVNDPKHHFKLFA